MNRFIPTIGASLMLAANVLTGEIKPVLVSGETREPADNTSYDLNVTQNPQIDLEGEQGVEQNIYMEPQGTERGRIIIYDNDYFAPKYQKNFVPMKNE